MKAKYLYIVSALALGLVGCSQDYESTEAPLSNTMSFNIVSPNAHTRVTDGMFEAEDKLGLYVTDYADEITPAPLQISGNRANNEAMVFDGTSWATERTIYWGEGKSDVYAYYPYMEVEDVDEQPFSVALDQDTDGAYEASDLLWAKAEGVAQADGAVSLQMQHSMSRLVVKIMAGEDYKGSLPEDATVHLHSTVTDVLFSLATGSVVKDPYAGTKSIKMRNCGIHTFADGEAVVYEAIVVPQMLLGTVPLLEINSKSVSYLLEDSFNFKPGTSYTYTAVLNTSTTSIKIDIGCDIDDWNNIGGGSGDDEGGEGGGEGGVDLSGYTDLSAEGTANCYLVQASGNYKFKATLGNTEYLVGNVKKTEVLWETFGTDVMPNVGDLIASTGYQDGYIYFSTAKNFNNGNASIAARNSKGVILWSWHIWCSEEGWNDQVYANNAGTMMDRNLGATSATPGDVGAFGLLYQWGRKDPFMGYGSSEFGSRDAASTGNWTPIIGPKTSVYAVSNPMTFIRNPWGEWCEGSGFGLQIGDLRWSESKKTPFDPCPAGYRVPAGGKDGIWAKAYVNSKGRDKYDGLYWELADKTMAWYPCTGMRGMDDEMLSERVTENGSCWSASMSGPGDYGDGREAHLFSYSQYGNSFGNPPGTGDTYRACGVPVRCVKE